MFFVYILINQIYFPKLNKTLLFITLIISLIPNFSFSQNAGDYRTAVITDSVWSNSSNWQTYNGTLSLWEVASTPPGSANDVYIQAGAGIHLSQNESCKNLYISTGTTDPSTGGDGQIILGDNVLTINDKLSCFYAPVIVALNQNIVPVSSAIIPSSPITKSSNSSSGRIKFTGNSRTIFQSGEWGSNNTGSPQTFDIELNLTSSLDSVKMGTTVRAYNWIISNGKLLADSNTIFADNGTTGQADVTINSSGKISSSCSGSGNPVITRDITSRMGNFSMSGFGQLWLTGSTPCMNAGSASMTGSSTVFYSAFVAQTFLNKGNDVLSATLNTYNGVNLMNSGDKTSLRNQNLIVNSAMVLNNFAYFILDSAATLSYGPSGILNYSSDANIKISNNEFPDVNGPPTVIINVPNGVLLEFTKTITTNIIFTAGTLTLLQGDLIITSGATITGVDSTKYIVTDDTTGKLTINNVSGSRLFPVGNSTYNPVIINNTGTPDNFSVIVQDSVDNPTLDNNKLVKRQWNISESVPGGSNAFLSFQWRVYQEGSNITDHSNMVVGHFTGVVYQDLTCSAVSGSDPYTITTTTPVTSFSPFVVGKQGVLPVELASFNSILNGRNVILSWVTNNEQNNAGFDIERKMDADNSEWTKVGSVSGNGTSSIPHSYTFLDRDLNSGNYNYRLKQVDNNGNFKFHLLSNEVIIGVPTKFDISQNFPNPFNPSTKINYDLPVDSKVNIKVFDMTGREVISLINGKQTAGSYTVSFNASALSSGVYFYQINAVGGNQSFMKTMKMLLVK